MPLHARIGVERVFDETSVKLTEPFSDQAIVVAPEDIAASITVEVARTDDIPLSSWIGVKWMLNEVSTILAEPLRD